MYIRWILWLLLHSNRRFLSTILSLYAIDGLSLLLHYYDTAYDFFGYSFVYSFARLSDSYHVYIETDYYCCPYPTASFLLCFILYTLYNIHRRVNLFRLFLFSFCFYSLLLNCHIFALQIIIDSIVMLDDFLYLLTFLISSSGFLLSHFFALSYS